MFSAVKNKISPENKSDVFNIIAQNIHCGYTLEPPQDAFTRRFLRVPTIYVLDQKYEN